MWKNRFHGQTTLHAAAGARRQHLSRAGAAIRRSIERGWAFVAGEFMRRFLLHVLPEGFHRIRHYGLFANGHRTERLALCRKLLGAEDAGQEPA